jgi:hypothetical protein
MSKIPHDNHYSRQIQSLIQTTKEEALEATTKMPWIN